MFAQIKQDLVADIKAITAFTNIPVVFGFSGDDSVPQVTLRRSAAIQPDYINSQGLKTTTITASVFAENSAQLDQLVDALYNRYHGFVGTINSRTPVQSIRVTSLLDLTESDGTERSILTLDIVTSE